MSGVFILILNVACYFNGVIINLLNCLNFAGHVSKVYKIYIFCKLHISKICTRYFQPESSFTCSSIEHLDREIGQQKVGHSGPHCPPVGHTLACQGLLLGNDLI